MVSEMLNQDNKIHKAIKLLKTETSLKEIRRDIVLESGHSQDLNDTEATSSTHSRLERCKNQKNFYKSKAECKTGPKARVKVKLIILRSYNNSRKSKNNRRRAGNLQNL